MASMAVGCILVVVLVDGLPPYARLGCAGTGAGRPACSTKYTAIFCNAVDGLIHAGTRR
jgi:hypothetical protein